MSCGCEGLLCIKIICDDDGDGNDDNPQEHHHLTPELLKRASLASLLLRRNAEKIHDSLPSTGGPTERSAENITSV